MPFFYLLSNFNFSHSITVNNELGVTDEVDEEFNADDLQESYMKGENKVPPLNVNLISILYKFLPSSGVFTSTSSNYKLKHYKALDLENFQNLLTNSLLSNTSKTPYTVFRKLNEIKDNIGNAPEYSQILNNIIKSYEANLLEGLNIADIETEEFENAFNNLFSKLSESFIVRTDIQSELIILTNLLISLPTNAVTNVYTVASDKGISNYTSNDVIPSFSQWYNSGGLENIDLHYDTTKEDIFIFGNINGGLNSGLNSGIKGTTISFYNYVATLENFENYNSNVTLSSDTDYDKIKKSYENNIKEGINKLDSLIKEVDKKNENSEQSIIEFLEIISIVFPLININNKSLIDEFKKKGDRYADLTLDFLLSIIKEQESGTNAYFKLSKSKEGKYNKFHTALYKFLKENNQLITSNKITDIFATKMASVRPKTLAGTRVSEMLEDGLETNLITGMIPSKANANRQAAIEAIKKAYNIGNMKVGISENTSKTISHLDLGTQIFLSALNPVQDLEANLIYSIGEITQPESKVTRFGYLVAWNVESVNRLTGKFEYQSQMNFKMDWIENAFLYNLRSDIEQFVKAAKTLNSFFTKGKSLIDKINTINKKSILTSTDKTDLKKLYDELDKIQIYKDYHLQEVKDGFKIKDIKLEDIDEEVNIIFDFEKKTLQIAINGKYQTFKLGRAFTVFQTNGVLNDGLFLNKITPLYVSNQSIKDEVTLINEIHSSLLDDKTNTKLILESFNKSIDSVYDEIESNFVLRNGDTYSPFGIQFNGNNVSFKDNEGNQINYVYNKQKPIEGVDYKDFVKAVVAANMVYATVYDKIINNEFAVNKNNVDKYKRAGSGGGMIKNSQGTLYGLVIPNSIVDELYINGVNTGDLDTADAQGYQIPSSHFKFSQDYGYSVRHTLDMKKIEWKLRT